MRRTAGTVTDDDEIGVERLEVFCGVLEGFALFERGGLGGKIDNIRAQANGGELEARARARGRLDEEIDDSLAAQGGDFLDGPLADRLEAAGGVEDSGDFLGR